MEVQGFGRVPWSKSGGFCSASWSSFLLLLCDFSQDWLSKMCQWFSAMAVWFFMMIIVALNFKHFPLNNEYLALIYCYSNIPQDKNGINIFIDISLSNKSNKYITCLLSCFLLAAWYNTQPNLLSNQEIIFIGGIIFWTFNKNLFCEFSKLLMCAPNLV